MMFKTTVAASSAVLVAAEALGGNGFTGEVSSWSQIGAVTALSIAVLLLVSRTIPAMTKQFSDTLDAITKRYADSMDRTAITQRDSQLKTDDALRQLSVTCAQRQAELRAIKAKT